MPQRSDTLLYTGLRLNRTSLSIFTRPSSRSKKNFWAVNCKPAKQGNHGSPFSSVHKSALFDGGKTIYTPAGRTTSRDVDAMLSSSKLSAYRMDMIIARGAQVKRAEWFPLWSVYVLASMRHRGLKALVRTAPSRADIVASTTLAWASKVCAFTEHAILLDAFNSLVLSFNSSFRPSTFTASPASPSTGFNVQQ